MRALADLAGLSAYWRADLGMAIPDHAARHYVLFDGEEPVVAAQVIWQRLAYFDVTMEALEGTFHVHMDLTTPSRPSVSWKAGVDRSIAGFTAVPEHTVMVDVMGMSLPSVTCSGWISTASGRTLAIVPTHGFGGEYVVFAPGGPALVTVAGTGSVHIKATIEGVPDQLPGRMIVSPEGASDPELGGLAAFAFAFANEQALMLHHEQPAIEAHRARAGGV
jgi:hypothetical protein